MSPYDWALALWLFGLSLAMMALTVRAIRLAEEVNMLQGTVREISGKLTAIQQGFDGLARAQQVDELRRQLVADLRPLIADAAAAAVSARKAPRAGKQIGIEFTGAATVTGPVTGGGVGSQHTGAIVPP